MRPPPHWRCLWAVLSSLFFNLPALFHLCCGNPLPLLPCCAIEMMAPAGPRSALALLGMIFRATPRQADVMIVAGWVNVKMAPFIKRLYDQMPEPKYVIAMGGCASAGGPYRDSITIVKGVDHVVPVDVYVYGCRPRPENLINGIVKLQEKIMSEKAMTRRGQEAPAREPIVIEG